MVKIWTPTWILACRAGTTSQYSTGETPPIKAERLELWDHLGSTCLRGSTSSRIWTRALQPDQEEVSCWRFHRAQIVSGRQTFRPIFWLGAEILTTAKVLSYPIFLPGAYILYTRQDFHETPIFWASTNILGTRQDFHETPIFWASANILGTRQDFNETPIFWASANNFIWRYVRHVTGNDKDFLR